MEQAVPRNTLLDRYAHDSAGNALPNYTDCFAASVDFQPDLETWVSAFYSTPLFRLERLILSMFGHGSSDADLAELIEGRRTGFAAWTVEDRRDDELLMKDVTGRTRSWFMVREQDETGSMLFFGSAVVARGSKSTSRRRLLYRLHRFYSRALIRAARRRLTRREG